jgi:hypothetical protein
MQRLNLCVLALLCLVLATPGQALECANSGTAPTTAPDDTNDGNATACGNGAIAGGATSTALGYQASSSGPVSAALGFGALSSGAGSIALGWNAASTAEGSTALGSDALATATFSTAIGNAAMATQPDTVIIGSVAGVNNAEDYTNVGMGTTTPVEAVDVERSAAAARFQLTSFTATASEAPQFIQRRARGTRLAPTAVQNNDNLGLFSFRGYNGSSMGGSRATITAQAAGNFTVSSTPTRLIFATTPVGQTVPQQVLVITPDGKVQVNGQNLTVPDYVFEDDYALMTLEELQAFIDANGHLPGVASAQQVNEEGLDLAGSQMGLLQKVEELTLYTLQQQSRIKQLEEQLASVIAKLD